MGSQFDYTYLSEYIGQVLVISRNSYLGHSNENFFFFDGRVKTRVVFVQ